LEEEFALRHSCGDLEEEQRRQEVVRGRSVGRVDLFDLDSGCEPQLNPIVVPRILRRCARRGQSEEGERAERAASTPSGWNRTTEPLPNRSNEESSANHGCPLFLLSATPGETLSEAGSTVCPPRTANGAQCHG